jgi:hypothetical protein
MKLDLIKKDRNYAHFTQMKKPIRARQKKLEPERPRFFLK